MNGVVVALFNIEIDGVKYKKNKEYEFVVDDLEYHVTGENNIKKLFRLADFNAFFKITKIN